MSCSGIAAAKSSMTSIVSRRRGVIEQAINERLDARLQRLEGAGGKGRRQELAHPCVDGRIVEDETRRVMLVQQTVGEVRPEVDCLVGAPRRRVVIDLYQIVVAGEKERAVRQLVHRRVLTQGPIGGVGIIQERLMQAREIKAADEVGREPRGRSGCGQLGHAITGASSPTVGSLTRNQVM